MKTKVNKISKNDDKEGTHMAREKDLQFRQ